MYRINQIHEIADKIILNNSLDNYEHSDEYIFSPKQNGGEESQPDGGFLPIIACQKASIAIENSDSTERQLAPLKSASTLSIKSILEKRKASPFI